MQILITGGAGFIGSALAHSLHRSGHHVVVLDNFNDYYSVDLKRDRVNEFLDGVTVIKGDILDSHLLDQVCSEHNFDVVCHLAGNAGVRYSMEHASEHIDANVKGTVEVYEAMCRHGIRQMVFASSSSVYGNDSVMPLAETAAADRPISIYGASKRACELIAYTYYQLHQIETTCLRFFTVYGPWSRPDMAMLKFAQAMTSGEPIDVYNEGNLRRDFTHIDDIVRGFTKAIEKPLGYEIINLGRGEAVPLLEYIDLLEAALGVTAKRNLLPMQPGDVYETFADTTKAKELLDFTATVPIAAGIDSFAHWYQSYYPTTGN